MELKKGFSNLAIMILASVLFLSPLVVAEGTDWTNWNSAEGQDGNRVSGEASYGDINNSAIITSSTQAIYNSSFLVSFAEPMVTGFNQSTTTTLYQNWQIVADGNYIRAYDSTFSIIDEYNVGSNVLGQIDVFSGAVANEQTLAGLWHNGADLSLNVFKWNRISNAFNLHSQLNISQNLNSTGVVCRDTSGAEIYTCYAWLYSYNGSTYSISALRAYGNGSYQINYLLNSSAVPYNIPQYVGDWDMDSVNEFIGLTNFDLWIVDDSMNIDKNISSGNCGSVTAPYYFRYAITGNTDSASQERMLVAKDTSGVVATCAGSRLTAYRPDMTAVWDNQLATFSGGATSSQSSISNIVKVDSNSDGFADAVIAYKSAIGVSNINISVFNGKDGTTLESVSYVGEGSTPQNMFPYPRTIITSTRLYPDYNRLGMRDIMLVKQSNGGLNNVRVYSFDNLTTFFQQNLVSHSGQASCQPVDFNVDGITDILCTSQNRSTLYTSSAVNLNAEISSILISSSTISAGNSIDFIINGTDYEGDSILYSIICDETRNATADSVSPFITCNYPTAGLFTATARVRDAFHFGSYFTYNVSILVTTDSSGLCNNNLVCEAGIGETNANCPADCPTGDGGNAQVGNNSLAIPLKLVDVDNENTGLLPTIYYGLLGGISGAGVPTFTFFILVFIVLFIFAFGALMFRLFSLKFLRR